MNIWEIDKLVLFLIFFIPGFISIKVYDLLVPRERRNFSKGLFETIGYSAINFAILSWLIVLIHTDTFYMEHKIWYWIILIVVLFVFPVLWPIIILKLSAWDPIAKHIVHPVLKPWDWVFRKREAFWVIVHLKNERKIGGKFDTESFASSYPAEEQIYLEQVWHLDENEKFIKPVDRSKGMLILSSEILSIEFFQ